MLRGDNRCLSGKVLRPSAKHHYGGKKRPQTPAHKTKRMAHEAAGAPPLESQVAELRRLGILKTPRSRLAAARTLKRIKNEAGLLR